MLDGAKESYRSFVRLVIKKFLIFSFICWALAINAGWCEGIIPILCAAGKIKCKNNNTIFEYFWGAYQSNLTLEPGHKSPAEKVYIIDNNTIFEYFWGAYQSNLTLEPGHKSPAKKVYIID